MQRDWPWTTSFLGKVIAVLAILGTNLYLFNLHDRSLDVGLKSMLRTRGDPSFSFSPLGSTMQEQKKSQNQMIATNDLSSKAVEAETMADEKPKATLRAGEYD